MIWVHPQHGYTWTAPDEDVTLHKNNLEATADPTVDDDAADGHSIGSVWWNIVLNKIFGCVDPTGGAAVWQLMGPSETPIVMLADDGAVTF